MPDQDDLNELLGALDAATDQLSAGQEALLLEHLGDIASRCVAAEVRRLRDLGVIPTPLDVVVRVERQDPRSST